MNQIWLLLGLKPEGFRSGLKRARDDTKDFEKDWQGLKKVFAAGGITTLALGFLKAFVADAQEARAELRKMGEPIPRTTQALAELGDAMDSFKTVAGTSVGFVVSGWQELFGVIASGINRLRGISEAQENERMAGLAAAEAAEARLAKARQENSPEKIAAAEKRLAEARRAAAFEAADNEGKMNMLLKENVQLRELVNTTGEKSIKGAEARIALEKNLTEIRKIDAAIAKEQEQTQKRVNDELEKFFGEVEKGAKKRQELAARLKEIEFDRLPLAQQIESLAKSESELQEKILAAKRAGSDTLQLQVDQAEIQIVLDEKRKQLAEQHLAVEQKKTSEMKKQASVMGFMVRGFSQYENASDAALRDLIAKNETLIADWEMKLRLSPNDLTTRMDLGRIQQESENARQELAFREGLRRDLAVGGEELARRNFKGDPLQFDEVLQRVTGQWDRQDEANDILRDIKTSLTSRDQTLAELPNQVRNLTAATQAIAVQLNQRGLPSS